jgi:hypothetical protein
MGLENFQADRLQFDDELEVMEVDFSDLTFGSTQEVNELYDFIESRIADTRKKWFFLVNYRNCHIEPDAWFAFGHRGKLLNKASSLGSVRYDASKAAQAEIKERAEVEKFDANLCASREEGLARIAELRAALPKRPAPHHHAAAAKVDYDSRVSFDAARQIMEVDFSDFTFATAADVNAFYDYVDHQLWKRANRWYFLVNYRNTHIEPDAWGAFAHRGKRVNLRYSLGSVRYDTSPETADEIRRKANTDSFDPNLCNLREAGLARIAEMRAQAAGA